MGICATIKDVRVVHATTKVYTQHITAAATKAKIKGLVSPLASRGSTNVHAIVPTDKRALPPSFFSVPCVEFAIGSPGLNANLVMPE